MAQPFGSTRRHTAPWAKRCGSTSPCNSRAGFAQHPVIGTGLSYGTTTKDSRNSQGRKSTGIFVGPRGTFMALRGLRCVSWADLQQRRAQYGLMEEGSVRDIGTISASVLSGRLTQKPDWLNGGSTGSACIPGTQRRFTRVRMAASARSTSSRSIIVCTPTGTPQSCSTAFASGPRGILSVIDVGWRPPRGSDMPRRLDSHSVPSRAV